MLMIDDQHRAICFVQESIAHWSHKLLHMFMVATLSANLGWQRGMRLNYSGPCEAGLLTGAVARFVQ